MTLVGRLLIFGLLCAAGCGAQGPYTIHASIEMPGASPRQIDEVVARPVARRLFRATGGVRDVTSISAAGKVDLFATSDGAMKRQEFVQAMAGSIADSADTLPRNAVAGPVELLPPGQSIPTSPVRLVEDIRIDIDRVKLIDAGLSYEDVSRAVAKAREDEAARPPIAAAIEAAAEHKIALLNGTTLPSRDTPVSLKDVAFVHVVSEPDCIVRRWP